MVDSKFTSPSFWWMQVVVISNLYITTIILSLIISIGNQPNEFIWWEVEKIKGKVTGPRKPHDNYKYLVCDLSFLPLFPSNRDWRWSRNDADSSVWWRWCTSANTLCSAMEQRIIHSRTQSIRERERDDKMWVGVVQSSSTAAWLQDACPPKVSSSPSFVGYADSIIARRCHHMSCLGTIPCMIALRSPVVALRPCVST